MVKFPKAVHIIGKIKLNLGTKTVFIKKGTVRFRKSNKTINLNKTYSTKPLVQVYGQTVFPEIAIVKIFKKSGWKGLWIDTFHNKYFKDMPNLSKSINLENKIKKILFKIKQKGGCWDNIIWNKNKILFIELKGIPSKDKIRRNQIAWLKAVIKAGLSADNFLIVEWDYLKR